MTAQPHDEKWMRRALRLAAKGKGHVEPNPTVGAVIVRDDVLVAEGYHHHYGGPHAEIDAIEAAADQCHRSTLYVTLEPCTGLGKKTPPCCEAVIHAGFRRVVIGTHDPTQDPAVPKLLDAGIQVTIGVLEQECRRLIRPFLKLRLHKKPYVIAKWAMTADGKIATVTGDAKWISSDPSRELVHKWRSEADAVLVGAGTVRRDDPRLTCRVAGGRNPLRIILDANASLPLDSALVRSVREAPILAACLVSAPEHNCKRLTAAGCRVLRLSGDETRVDVDELLHHLGEQQITNLLVEGGAKVLGYLFDHRLVDEVRVFVAPKLVGGAAAPSPVAGRGVGCMGRALKLEHPSWTQVGTDLLLTAFLRNPHA